MLSTSTHHFPNTFKGIFLESGKWEQASDLLTVKMLQVIKVGKPSASWKPQHLVLFYASSINLLLQELRINVSTTVLFLLFQLVNLYLCYSYSIPPISSPIKKNKNDNKNHLWRSQTNPTLYLLLKTFDNKLHYSKVSNSLFWSILIFHRCYHLNSVFSVLF